MAKAEEVRIFAAASLQTVLDALYAEQDVALIYAGSSALARQVMAGAPADIFISANEAWADAVEEARGAVAGRQDIASGSLVVIGPAGTAHASLAEALAEGRIAMALVDAVPAGLYGRQALRATGLWDATVPRVVQTDNVRAALALVASGAVPRGIVYASDALAEPRIVSVTDIPPALHDPIRYPALLLGESAAAREAYEALSGAEAAALFAANGFLPADG